MTLRRDPLDRETATGRLAALGREAWLAVTGGRGRLEPRDPIVLVAIYLLAVSLVFVAVPALDLAVTRPFFANGGFQATNVEALVALRRVGDQTIGLTVIVLIASLLGKLVWPEKPIAIRPRSTVFLLASLALGPGLVVNALFKSLSGRPRPIAVDVFGGPSPFVPAWQFSDHCASNCSFISGEASSAMWLMGLAFLAPPALRPWFGLPIGALALALSANRIAFGGHFASDVLISFGFTLLVMIVLYRLIVTSPFGDRLDAAIEGRLAAAGSRIRARFR